MTEALRNARDLGYHSACLLLTLGYAHALPVWQTLVAMLGPTAAGLAPFGAVAMILLAVMMRARCVEAAWLPLALGGAITLAILALPDGQFPAKRSHVVEYLVMAVLVRRMLCRTVSGWALAVLGAVVTALYGMHDEFIQGLTPGRTFGQRDILVDVLSGTAGSMMLHGLRLFDRQAPPSPPGWTATLVMPEPLMTGFGVLLLLWPIPAYEGHVLPLWPVLPLLAGGFVWTLAPPPDHAGLRRSLDQVLTLALLLAVWPGLSHTLGLPFR